MSLVLLNTLSINGYCDDWVYIESSDNTSTYYKPSSVKINNENRTINVLIKKSFTLKGKNKVIDIFIEENPDIKNMEFTMEQFIIDYNGHMFQVEQTTIYSKSGEIIESFKFPPLWTDIIPGSTCDKLFNKLIKKYKIQR